FLELAHERVVCLIGDRRLIEDVVLVVRLLDLLPKVSDALLGGRRDHGLILSQRPGQVARLRTSWLLCAVRVTGAKSDVHAGCAGYGVRMRSAGPILAVLLLVGCDAPASATLT